MMNDAFRPEYQSIDPFITDPTFTIRTLLYLILILIKHLPLSTTRYLELMPKESLKNQLIIIINRL